MGLGVSARDVRDEDLYSRKPGAVIWEGTRQRRGGDGLQGLEEDWDRWAVHAQRRGDLGLSQKRCSHTPRRTRVPFDRRLGQPLAGTEFPSTEPRPGGKCLHTSGPRRTHALFDSGSREKIHEVDCLMRTSTRQGASRFTLVPGVARDCSRMTRHHHSRRDKVPILGVGDELGKEVSIAALGEKLISLGGTGSAGLVNFRTWSGANRNPRTSHWGGCFSGSDNTHPIVDFLHLPGPEAVSLSRQWGMEDCDNTCLSSNSVNRSGNDRLTRFGFVFRPRSISVTRTMNYKHLNLGGFQALTGNGGPLRVGEPPH